MTVKPKKIMFMLASLPLLGERLQPRKFPQSPPAGLHAMAEPFESLEHLRMGDLDRVEDVGLLVGEMMISPSTFIYLYCSHIHMHAI